jgi:hypothetical protein
MTARTRDRLHWSRRGWRGSTASKEIHGRFVSRSRSRSRNGRRLLSLLLLRRCYWSWSRGGRTHTKVLVVLIIVVFHSNPRHLGHYGTPPNGNWLTIVDTVHPHGHGALFAISTRHQGSLEPEMVTSRQGKRVLDLTERGRVSLLSGFGSQKDIGLQFRVPVFRNKVSVQYRVVSKSMYCVRIKCYAVFTEEGTLEHCIRLEILAPIKYREITWHR